MLAALHRMLLEEAEGGCGKILWTGALAPLLSY